MLGLGLMSGTSLDGLDLALCEFQFSDDRYKFEIVRAETIKYDVSWTKKLLTAKDLSEVDLDLLHQEYGNFLGDEVNRFLVEENKTIDFIASHGHTVKHDPANGITVQIGDGSCIANKSGLLVVHDFRSENVAEGGQGAPLVPIGDLKLFSDYPMCLNLGGIANISIQKGNKIEAYDITSCNIGFNHYAKLKGLEFDESGKLGQSGEIHKALFNQLNALNYFKKSPPKSLDASFFYREMLPLIEGYHLDIPSASRTYYEHVAFQISSVIEDKNLELLITGGGAYNDFLIDLLKNKYHVRCKIPNQVLIDFKEALIFAFMGALRLRGENNCLACVTVAKKDQSTGIITYPKSL
jgi:anhydro-N-acetylmuramic acid kinase